jgi:hypothetical protein
MIRVLVGAVAKRFPSPELVEGLTPCHFLLVLGLQNSSADILAGLIFFCDLFLAS